jgi:hypothetical protein
VIFSASPAGIRRHAPRFCEHGEAAIADLRASGALIPPS